MSAQRFWEEHRKVLSVVGISLLAAIAFRLVVIGPVGRAASSDRTKYESLSARLEMARRGALDLADATDSLRGSSEQLDGELTELKKQVEISFPDWTQIPDTMRNDPGAYFALKHAEIRDELYIECQKARRPVKLLDDTIGWPNIGSTPLNHKQAQEDLNRLSIVKKLVQLLVKAGVREVVEIKPAPPVMTGADGQTEFIREYPVQILVTTRLDPLMGFLHEIRRPGEFFLVVRELTIRGQDIPKKKDGAGVRHKVDDRELDVTISAAGMRFPVVEEPESKKRGPHVRGAGGPKVVPGRALGF